MSTSCIFCQIVSGNAPATVVKEWREVLAIVPLGPVNAGHVIVMPKLHVINALESPEVTGIVMSKAAEIAPNPSNIIINTGRAATQTVFHLHIHIVPRAIDDGLALPWYSGKGNHGKS